MAVLEFNNVRIAGIAAGVPKNVVSNLDIKEISKDYDAEAFVETTGVKERRFGDYTASDLSFAAAEKLIADLGWEKSEIDALIFVSQHADYILPATACTLQERLGLSKQCYAMDISLGCSGWVYGLSTVCALVSNGGIKKALLLCGDAKRRAKFDDALFGYAGTATALVYDETAESIKFDLGTDGSGYDAIITLDGGARNQFTSSSLELEEVDGKMQNRLQSRMKGMDVFSFGITTVPKSIKKMTAHFGIDYTECDYLILHQANKKMNDFIAKKLKFPEENVPSCLYNFGNTSSASIPLTIVTQLKNKVENKYSRFLCCGFGVGLSWGTVAFNTNSMVLSDLVEVDEHTDLKIL